jgi:RNA polymerase sigma-70 factor (ECF subfamily)
MENIDAALPNEQAWVARAVAEPAAFAVVYDHYFPRVYNYVRYRVGDAGIADDITAQVFERILVNMADYRPERGPFAAWLFAIARNAVNDYLRARSRHPWLTLDGLRPQARDDPKPEEQAIRDETRAELLIAVSHLNDHERELIALKFVAGLTNRHIAELTGLKESNVGVILYRAVRRLRAELGDKE